MLPKFSNEETLQLGMNNRLTARQNEEQGFGEISMKNVTGGHILIGEHAKKDNKSFD